MIVDTGVIYADIDRADDWHAAAAELLSTAPGPLRVPAPVITEVCYLLETRLGPIAERWIGTIRRELTVSPNGSCAPSELNSPTEC